ncbi:MAG: hypothetical protein ACLP3R_11170 [Candidatus Korobacteraceae bacterium]
MSGKTILNVPGIGDVAIPITPSSMDGMVIGASVPTTGNFTVLGATTVVAFGQVIAPSIIVSGTVTLGGPVLVPVQTSINITATTNSLAAATPLVAGLNVVVSVSGTGPVALPSAATFVGGSIAVFNQSTHTVAVWPQPLDGIDALGTTAAILLDSGKRALFFGIAGAVGTTTLGSIISAQMGTTSA